MTVVVDLGCETYGEEESVLKLVSRFNPTRLYGFDPWHGTVASISDIGRTRVVIARAAAWIFDGVARYEPDLVRPTRSTMLGEESAYSETVDCFDFSAWLARLERRVVLKMDVEGAEYPVLEKMHDDGTDELVDRLLVEWHPVSIADRARQAVLVDTLRCGEVEEWT